HREGRPAALSRDPTSRSRHRSVRSVAPVVTGPPRRPWTGTWPEHAYEQPLRPRFLSPVPEACAGSRGTGGTGRSAPPGGGGSRRRPRRRPAPSGPARGEAERGRLARVRRPDFVLRRGAV